MVTAKHISCTHIQMNRCFQDIDSRPKAGHILWIATHVIFHNRHVFVTLAGDDWDSTEKDII